MNEFIHFMVVKLGWDISLLYLLGIVVLVWAIVALVIIKFIRTK